MALSLLQNTLDVDFLRRQARTLRLDVIRMLEEAGSGHPGGSLSAADLVAALYFGILRHDPANPGWPERDRFVLSKGHAVPVLYAALAESGYFPREELKTLRRIDSRLQGHPSHRDLPAVEASTGSLGQGLSIGAGMALGARLDGRESRVFVLLGDGELQEGQVWEAALSAPRWQLENLVAIVDYNRLQLDGPVDEILPLEPLAEKWRQFGWDVAEIDGHEMAEIVPALLWASRRDREAEAGGDGALPPGGLKLPPRRAGRPAVLIAHTVKGKGVSFMEGNNEFHGRAPTREEAARALAELGGEA
ncbi:MAG: transketolase [Bacillota bacterium]|nr:transketolase [Bacillota bacterium]